MYSHNLLYWLCVDAVSNTLRNAYARTHNYYHSPLISNIGHNELWQPLGANSISVTLKLLWSLSITNCRSNWLQMVHFLSQFNHKMANLATLLKVCLHLKQNKHRSAHIIVGKAHNIHEVTTFLKSQRGVKIITKIFLH